jgi:hypothetical protein
LTLKLRFAPRALLVILSIAACCIAHMAFVGNPVAAQPEQTVTLRMLDSKSGVIIATNNFLVRVNHEEDVHGNWVAKNEDGSGRLVLPGYAKEVLIHATYEDATLTYVNCDSDKDRGTAEHAASIDHWYSVATILSSGIVAPNQCIGKKVPEKLQVVAKPGEFVFFVRPMNTVERFKE